MKMPNYIIEPFGAYKSIIEHPYIANKAVEVAVFHEHRLAFYYWSLWTKGVINGRSLDKPPILVSFDWHEDTVSPDDHEKQELEKLTNSQSKLVTLANEIALFSWLKLNPLNDGHILSAAYQNLISDIFIVCKQEHDINIPFTDMYGNVHHIYSSHMSTPDSI